jgi:hypothetical protein
MATNACGWPWSSALAHSDPRALNPVLDGDWQHYAGKWGFAEWREILEGGMEPEQCDSVRRSTYTGQPLGEERFLASLEQEAGRKLRVLKRGRPFKADALPATVGATA